jgi:molybdate transport system substrate-binding protein
MSVLRLRNLSLVLPLAFVLLLPHGARAAELHLLAAGSVRPILADWAAEYRRESGAEVRITFGAMGPLKAKLNAGEPADVAILTPVVIEELAKAGKVRAETRVNLGRVGVGVAAKAGGARPDLSTPAAFRQALLAAPVLAYGDPKLTSSGAYFAQLLDQLGLAEQVRAKSRLLPDGYDVMEFIAKGSGGELGVTQISEVQANAALGVQMIGPLPGDLQHYTVYAAVLTARTAQPEAAQALIRALTAPPMRARFAAGGFEPVP